MTILQALGEVISTDVLIIGGGIGGLVAATKARQTRPVSVVVVDKATPGYAGQGPLVGGVVAWLPESRIEEWFRLKVESGEYLNDQEVTYVIGSDMHRLQIEMARWGAPFRKDDKGELLTSPFMRCYEVLRWPSPSDMMKFFRKRASQEGAKILKRTMVVNLLRDGKRAVGAVGFDIDSGQFRIFKAKATIIANGACQYRWEPYFTTSSGEGVAMAYDAGAEMRNAEFANAVGPVSKEGNFWKRGTLHPYLFNASGENLCDRYGIDKGHENRAEISRAMYKEILGGRGPIYWDGSKDPVPIPMLEMTKRTVERLGITLNQKVEFVLAPSTQQGAIRTDANCRTTVPGLWSVGDASVLGSGINGAQVSNPAEGIPRAEVTGYRAGMDAAMLAEEIAQPRVHGAEVARLKEQVFAPLVRRRGLDPNDAIYQVQEVVIPLKYNFFRAGDRMNEALAKLSGVKEGLERLQARDLHYLVKCHEVTSMVCCAEMTYRAALMREESRGCHMREDYPERDDENWLKWIIIKKVNNRMRLWTEDVPVDRYRLKPRKVVGEGK